MPLFGPSGLAAQPGVQEYARERKFRERIRNWLKLVSAFWPEWPAAVSFSAKRLDLRELLETTRADLFGLFLSENNSPKLLI